MERSRIFSTYAGPEPEQLPELEATTLRHVISPAEIVREFEKGHSVEALARRVHYTGLFRNKSLSRDYVQRCLYHDAQSKREPLFWRGSVNDQKEELMDP